MAFQNNACHEIGNGTENGCCGVVLGSNGDRLGNGWQVLGHQQEEETQGDQQGKALGRNEESMLELNP